MATIGSLTAKLGIAGTRGPKGQPIVYQHVNGQYTNAGVQAALLYVVAALGDTAKVFDVLAGLAKELSGPDAPVAPPPAPVVTPPAPAPVVSKPAPATVQAPPVVTPPAPAKTTGPAPASDKPHTLGMPYGELKAALKAAGLSTAGGYQECAARLKAHNAPAAPPAPQQNKPAAPAMAADTVATPPADKPVAPPAKPATEQKPDAPAKKGPKADGEYRQLQAECKAAGVSAKGNTEELKARLQEHGTAPVADTVTLTVAKDKADVLARLAALSAETLALLLAAATAG